MCASLLFFLFVFDRAFSWSSSFEFDGHISPSSNHFLQKYAVIKLYESCFGLESMQRFRAQVKEATEYCLQIPTDSNLALDGQQLLKPSPLPMDDPPTIHRNPWLHQFVTTSHDVPPQDVHSAPNDVSQMTGSRFKLVSPSNSVRDRFSRPTLWVPSAPHVRAGMVSPWLSRFPIPSGGRDWLGRFRRQSSSPSPTPSHQHQEELRKGIISKISNVTCILTQLHYLDAEGVIDQTHLKEEVQKTTSQDAYMRDELVRAVDTCSQFSSCLPLDEHDSVPIARRVAPAVLFVNCFKGKRMEACIKKDLRERLKDLVEKDTSHIGAAQELDEILSRSDPFAENVSGAFLPRDGEDLDTFVFALLYEEESRAFF